MSKKKPAPLTRVTLGDIARLAKVHHSTVSRALRNHPAISDGTRERIYQLAAKLAYRPDPMLTALASYRKGRAPVSYQQNLAWLTNFPTPDGWRYRQIMVEYLQGARQRADQLGYGIEEIWFPTLSDGGKKPAETLMAKGIRGLLLPPQPASHTHINLPWADFLGVSFGFSLTRPALHSVSNFQYASIVKLARHLIAHGFQRPALVCSRNSDERLNFAWSAGFWAATNHLGVFRKELLYLPEKLEEAAFLSWHARVKPDVIIVDGAIRVPNDLGDTSQNSIYHWLGNEGLRVPDDVSVAVLALPAAEKYFAGITENAAEIGSAAIDMLTAGLQRGESGPPRLPKRMSVEGSYRSGASIRPPVKAPA